MSNIFYFFKIAKIIIKDTRANKPFSPNKFITSEKLFKTFQKPVFQDQKSTNQSEIAMNNPRTS